MTILEKRVARLEQNTPDLDPDGLLPVDLIIAVFEAIRKLQTADVVAIIDYVGTHGQCFTVNREIVERALAARARVAEGG